jgi:cyclase
MHKKGLVKSVQFKDYKYVGDPINAVKIFNEKEADELMVVDIDASVQGYEPDLKLIGHLADECRMPLCYGGGITTIEQARALISLGVEKIALSSAFIARPQLVREIADELGSQSVVVVLDVKKKLLSDRFEVCTHNGKTKTGLDPLEVAEQAQDFGAGELVINSIDKDGTMKGYEWALLNKIRDRIHLPLTALGGAGSWQDIETLVAQFGIIGAAAGSLFVFKGPYKAVLINYPGHSERAKLLEQNKLLSSS